MYVMRGSMPVKVMAHYMKNPWMKFGTRYFGNLLMKPEPFTEGYFLEDALKVKAQVKIPVIYVGGLKSKEMIDKVLELGFDFVQIARALIHDPGFINKLKTGEVVKSGCQSSNYCIARMYSGQMACYQNETDGPREMGR
jgi:2,4-dienoyl-CoA reductase-like NADH-dependent reductase (Old Yellow Enzyme family)